MQSLNPVLKDLSSVHLQQLQRIVEDSAGLLWITQGGMSAHPDLSLFHGFARSIRSECEGFHCIHVDLDAESQVPSQQAGDLIFQMYEQNFGKSRSRYTDLADREFYEKNGILRVKRAVEDTKINKCIAARTMSVSLEPELLDLHSL